ncbi:FAD dependent oxidoreductase [Cantharellus anzutake]|uniref:FAD dependent oxidoreductase n=1 Tax=Cantharellus anzutake TaxID=1750568 RepID=UPI0019085352|nr:FAD dependent oxidoreductase [Cantharellus anzutake]KAF8336978.1 FAD dependent oxidoreductase [Cantharellus anzutake]
MLLSLSFLLFPSFILTATYARVHQAANTRHRSQPDARFLPKHPTCAAIEEAISSASSVYYFPDIAFITDNYHYMPSSSQNSECSVEPGAVDDVAKIMEILSNSTTPFGVKGGGHSSNPGFSSTPGVLIVMTRFNNVNYRVQEGTADIQTGVIWDDVYAALAPHGVNVVGGRASGVGVAGLTLGGGYSWLTNLYGLTVDTVVAFELVLPNGTVVEARDDRYPDLFFGLKGGLNNFGIVTRFTLRTFPQTQVWAGVIMYSGLVWERTVDAVYAFIASNTDPNANILAAYTVAGGVQVMPLLVFYNRPQPPSKLFDNFFNIPHLSSTVGTKDFLDFVKEAPSNVTANLRGAFHTVPLANITPAVLNKIVSEAKLWGLQSLLAAGISVSYDVEPFLRTITRHAASSAYPHDKFASPLLLYFEWPPSISDSTLINAMKASASSIAAVAKGEGQDLDSLASYPNYCLADTPLERMYGSNLDTLRAIKKKYDSSNVMGRAGGFKF